jgi:hypothetical protein
VAVNAVVGVPPGRRFRELPFNRERLKAALV